jgi:hypothetical protein
MKSGYLLSTLLLFTSFSLSASEISFQDIQDEALEQSFNDGFEMDHSRVCGKKCEEKKKKEEEAAIQKKLAEAATQKAAVKKKPTPKPEDDKATEEAINIFQKNQALKFLMNQFKAARALPSLDSLQLNNIWLCQTYNAFKVEGFGQIGQRERTLQFSTFGAIIKNVRPVSGDLVDEYFPDVELAGHDINEELYEALRVSENGDLIVETSIHGLSNVSYFKKIFGSLASLFSGNIDFDKLIITLKGLLSASVSNTENKGLVVAYSYCPLNELIGADSDNGDDN